MIANLERLSRLLGHEPMVVENVADRRLCGTCNYALSTRYGRIGARKAGLLEARARYFFGKNPKRRGVFCIIHAINTFSSWNRRSSIEQFNNLKAAVASPVSQRVEEEAATADRLRHTHSVNALTRVNRTGSN